MKLPAVVELEVKTIGFRSMPVELQVSVTSNGTVTEVFPDIMVPVTVAFTKSGKYASFSVTFWFCSVMLSCCE